MRRIAFLALAVVACAKTETPKADTAAVPAPAPAAAAAPAPLTPADVAGTWNGTTMAVGSDSVINHFVVKSVTDSTGTFTAQGSKAGVPYTLAYSGDSLIATSVPYNDPTLPKGSPKVTFLSVAHLTAGKLVGTAAIRLASKSDSVLMRSRWEATKAP